jgi:tRNA-2-methylthio-N6-dimethylallyladenosine synthase
MNVSDSEVVLSILAKSGYCTTGSPESADVVLVNTCAIRENAEARIWGRLGQFQHYKKLRRVESR